MTNEQIFDILRPIILSVTGVPECILANPNAPAPTTEYAAVQPQQTVAQRGQANITRNGKAGALMDVDVRAQIACTAWVNFYRGDSRSRAAKLHQCNKRPDVSATLFKAKLGWAGTQPINNLTALQSENYESRAQIAINLWYETTDPVEINTIERLSGEIQYEDGTVVSTFDIETPDAPPIP